MDNVLSQTQTSISAVTAVTTGTAIFTGATARMTWQVIATGVTSGGTVLIEGSLDNENFYELASVPVTATGSQSVVVDEIHTWQRARVSSRTDGTYTVKYAPEEER